MSDFTFPTSGTQKEKPRSVRFQDHLKYFWDLTVRRKWLIVVFVLLGSVAGGVGAWFHRDVYRSSAVIVVEQQRGQEFVSSVAGGDTPERVSMITQRVLSRTNLKKVIDTFQLSPDIVNSRGYEPAIRRLRENITIEIKRSRGQLEALTISFAHHDPMMAMKVTSGLASQYVNENSKLQEPKIDSAQEFLEQELSTAKQELEEREKALNDYKRRFLRELPGQLETNLRTLDRLQLEKIRIQETLHGLHSRRARVRKTISNYESNGDGRAFSALQLSQLKAALAQIMGSSNEDNAGIDYLKRQIAKIESDVAQRANPDHESEMATGNTYLADLKDEHAELKNQMAQLERQLTKTSNMMVALEKRIQRIPERGQELLVLERQYEVSKGKYQHLSQKRINVQISDEFEKRQRQQEFFILDTANLPVKPEGWSRTFIALGGLVGGVGMGFGVAFLLDFLFPTFRRSRDVEVLLGFPLLVTIPRFQMAYDTPMKMLSGGVETAAAVNGSGTGMVQESYVDVPRGKGKAFPGRSSTHHAFPPQFNLVSKWRPQSLVSEQFRVAATRLDLLGERPMGNVALVSSAMQGEGKTSTAANLAYTLARDLDEPTLVIDCDYKRPNLHNVFMLHSCPGVADYLAGQASLESCFQQYADLPLWCLSVGDIETHPVSLAKLQHLSTLIESVRTRYRFIILDGPPILPLADINVLSRLADIILMVVRSGTTPKDVGQKAIEMLHASNVTRIILTDVWSHGLSHYMGHSYAKQAVLPRHS